MRTFPFRTISIPAVFSSFNPLLLPPPIVVPKPSHFLRTFTFSPVRSYSSSPPPPLPTPSPVMEKQFEEFRAQLDESGSVRERIRAVVAEIESAIRIMHAGLLLVHQSHPVPEVLERSRAQIGVLKVQFARIAEILRECPGQYYRYHGDWKSETQTAVSLLAFLHWLEIGDLLMQTEAEQKLGYIRRSICSCFHRRSPFLEMEFDLIILSSLYHMQLS